MLPRGNEALRRHRLYWKIKALSVTKGKNAVTSAFTVAAFD